MPISFAFCTEEEANKIWEKTIYTLSQMKCGDTLSITIKEDMPEMSGVLGYDILED